MPLSRSELVESVVFAAMFLRRHGIAPVGLEAAAEELSKTCDGCQSFARGRNLDDGWCLKYLRSVPYEGSGFCHRWEAQKISDRKFGLSENLIISPEPKVEGR